MDSLSKALDFVEDLRAKLDNPKASEHEQLLILTDFRNEGIYKLIKILNGE